MRSTFPRPRARKRWCGISTARTSTSIPDRIRPSGCGRCWPKASRSPTSTSIGGRPTRASRRITWSSPRSSGGRRPKRRSPRTTAAVRIMIARSSVEGHWTGRRPDVARFVMIALVAAASAIVLTLLATVLWLSFTEGTPGDPALGYSLRHYVEVFLDRFTYEVLWNTFLFQIVTLLVAFALALPIAWLTERTDFPGKPAVFTLMTVALLIPGFAVALGWVFLLHPRIGVINQALIGLFGLAAAPFDIASILGMGIVEGLSLSPLTFIMTSVVLRSMDPALEEAAAMSGGDLRVGGLLRRLRRPGRARPHQPHLHVLHLRVPPAHADRRAARIRRGRDAERDHGRVRGGAQLVLPEGSTPGAALRRRYRQGLSAAHLAARTRQMAGGGLRRGVLPGQPDVAAVDAVLGLRPAVPAAAVGRGIG